MYFPHRSQRSTCSSFVPTPISNQNKQNIKYCCQRQFTNSFLLSDISRQNVLVLWCIFGLNRRAWRGRFRRNKRWFLMGNPFSFFLVLEELNQTLGRGACKWWRLGHFIVSCQIHNFRFGTRHTHPRLVNWFWISLFGVSCFSIRANHVATPIHMQVPELNNQTVKATSSRTWHIRRNLAGTRRSWDAGRCNFFKAIPTWVRCTIQFLGNGVVGDEIHRCSLMGRESGLGHNTGASLKTNLTVFCLTMAHHQTRYHHDRFQLVPSLAPNQSF